MVKVNPILLLIDPKERKNDKEKEHGVQPMTEQQRNEINIKKVK